MNNSEAGRAGQFKRGNDPRRHKGGRKSKEAIELSTALLNALTEEGKKEEKFKQLAETIWKKALAGHPWAVEIVLDRFLGKAAQPIEGDINITLRRVITDERPKE